jgi:drug/metabolite transporter (DMT)-like permease
MTSKAIQMIGAARVSMIGAVGPIATIFFGWLFLSEEVTLLQMVGAALVLAGVILVARKPTPKPMPRDIAEARGEAIAAAATGD